MITNVSFFLLIIIITSSQLSGNKMDIHNLATLFGPNILRKTKGGQDAKDLHGEASDYVEESRDVINVVERLIEYNKLLFEVSE